MDRADIFREETEPSRPEQGTLAVPQEVVGEPETALNLTGSEETFESKPAEVQTPAPAYCPRCGEKLVTPETLGLCQRCGYCRSLDDARGKLTTQSHPGLSRPALRPLVERAKRADWLWILLGGLAGIGLISAIAIRCLPPGSLERTVWSTAQFSLGVLAVLGAQVWALMLVLPYDASLGFADLFFSVRLWARTLRRLPDTCWPLWLAAWGLALTTCALLLFGQVSFRPETYREAASALSEPQLSPYRPQRELRDAIRNWEQQEDTTIWASALTELEGRNDLGTPADHTNVADDRPRTQCVILGYVPQADGTPASVVLGGVKDGKFHYAGVARQVVPDRQVLLQRLLPLQRREKPIAGTTDLKAIWVKPQLSCEVQYSEIDAQGVLREPRISTLLGGSSGQ